MSDYLDCFIESYHQWTLSGKSPVLASAELNYYLKQKKKRLEKKRLQLEEDYEHVNGEIRGDQKKEGHPYYVRILYREARHILNYHQDGKLLKSFKEPVVFYGSLLDKEGYEDHLLSCPNCGHETMASLLKEGCPYCGTHFEMDDVYPCFTSFYSVPMIVERDRLMKVLKRNVLIGGGGSAIVLFVLSIITDTEMVWWFRIIKALFLSALMGGMCAVMVYMTMSMFLLIRVFMEAGRSLPLLGGISTGKKLTVRMKGYDPDFSYPYFEGRLIALFRSIAFSEAREKLSIYTGHEDLSFLDDAVDLSYRGASKLKSFKEEDGRLKITMKIYMHNTYMKEKITRKDEDLLVTMERKAGHEDPGFRAYKVQCPNCGGSFDAMHQKKCPHCSSEYELVNEDWVISSITKA